MSLLEQAKKAQIKYEEEAPKRAAEKRKSREEFLLGRFYKKTNVLLETLDLIDDDTFSVENVVFRYRDYNFENIYATKPCCLCGESAWAGNANSSEELVDTLQNIALPRKCYLHKEETSKKRLDEGNALVRFARRVMRA